MLQKRSIYWLLLLTQSVWATESVDYYQKPASQINGTLTQPQTKQTAILDSSSGTLKVLNQTNENGDTVTRYQQFYKGIPIVGAQITITQDSKKTLANGQLLEDIQVNTTPTLSAQEALDLAKKSYFKDQGPPPIKETATVLQIRPADSDKLSLVYQVSFKTTKEDDKPVWPFFIIDAHTGVILKEWNNIRYFLDSGPGGNEKVHEYWYGKDGLPSLNVAQAGELCTMNTSAVKLVRVAQAWDWENSITTAFSYPCNRNNEETINGGFSPSNDAYYFGHTVVDMYKNWYGLNALQNTNGTPMQLVMRVHFGKSYDNAFWDGRVMSFGDGQYFYPLVSLDVAGHEVTHGFTEQHANLEYHDQSGALNESVSDMAGQAARAYLLETVPLLYKKAYLQNNQVTWGIGETITKAISGALRFMNNPSTDGSSADCLDKALATSKGGTCTISYNELLTFAETNYSDLDERQSFIVHTASGIFNKAFYLWSKQVGIKQAYQAMVLANTKYWTPTTDFILGACGVIYAAKDLKMDVNVIKTVFGQVGVDTGRCAI